MSATMRTCMRLLLLLLSCNITTLVVSLTPAAKRRYKAGANLRPDDPLEIIDPSVLRRLLVANVKSQPSSRLFAVPPSIDGGLSTTLKNLNDQWELQKRSKSESRWSVLDVGGGTSSGGDSNSDESAPPNSFGTDNVVYLLEPQNRLPSSIIVFTGGAVLGTYPHVAYNEFLVRISNRLNASILTAPYSITTLDHWELAKQTGDKARKAIVKLQDEQNYSEKLPVYSLSHSLGSKLACIYAAATQQSFQGIGLIAFNNFSFQKSVSMSRSFAEKINKADPQLLDTVFNFAEMAVTATGWEFSPSPEDMERLIKAKFQKDTAAPDRQTVLFQFENDSLDCADQFPAQTTTVRLPGSHLSPVYIQLSLEDLPESTVGFKNISFGDEQELETLVDMVCHWILGKPMTKPVEKLAAAVPSRADARAQ